jgi:hypothetical protein
VTPRAKPRAKVKAGLMAKSREMTKSMAKPRAKVKVGLMAKLRVMAKSMAKAKVRVRPRRARRCLAQEAALGCRGSWS